MTCTCGEYISCGDKSIEVGVYSESDSFAHSVNNITSSNDVLGLYQKTTRNFSVNYGWDRSISPGYAVSGCEFILKCDSAENAASVSHCSEYCKREINVPWYWDRQRGIYVWKHVEEELQFSVSSNKTALFRMKFGNGYFHKICIPSSVKTYGKEQFIMMKDGVQTVLAEVSYSYNPFPLAEGGSATWGLYGNAVSRTATPDTADVACILLFPAVPKQAIALDNDVIAYGFYDYNAVEGGLIESSLPKDDGGKDYFYPYWCRQMPTDPLWRSTADQRYDVIYSTGQTNLAGTVPWYPSEPVAYPWPFGSFALDSKDNFIASCVLWFGEHANSKGVVYNETGMGDLFAAITKAGVPISSKFTSVYPVVPL